MQGIINPYKMQQARALSMAKTLLEGSSEFVMCGLCQVYVPFILIYLAQEGVV